MTHEPADPREAAEYWKHQYYALRSLIVEFESDCSIARAEIVRDIAAKPHLIDRAKTRIAASTAALVKQEGVLKFEETNGERNGMSVVTVTGRLFVVRDSNAEVKLADLPAVPAGPGGRQ